MKPITREPKETKESFLFRIYNKYGHENMRLAFNIETDEGLAWSKWIRYDELISRRQDEWVSGLHKMTRKEFMQKCTHRTIAPCEVIYDVDEVNTVINREVVQRFKDIKSHTKHIIGNLKEDYVIYWTGNKSYHINTIIPRLVMLNERTRSDIKEKMLSDVGADIQKKSDNCMIAIEGEPHYRSGKPKSIVHLDPVKDYVAALIEVE